MRSSSIARHFPSSWHIRILTALLLLVVLTIPVTAAETLSAALQVQPATSCPQGCSCIPAGQAANLQYVQCPDATNPCGYDSAKQPLYCYKPPAAACPSGCECLSDSDAKVKYGTYVRCSETSCGVSSATTAAMIPKYCVKSAPTVTLTLRTLTLVPTPTCPSGCECMPESTAAQQPNVYVRCSDTACSQVTTGSAVIKSYCYRKTTVSPASCPSGCSCMPEAKAKEAYGSYERCSETPCSAGSANTATAAAAPDYCFRAKTTTTPSVCPEGCDCITPDDAKLKFGFLPDRCSSGICGYYQPVTTAASPIAKYCFKRPAVTPTVTTSPVCPEGCLCLSKEEGVKYGFPVCHGTTTICGYDNSKAPLYCFEKVPSSQCIYDYKNNTCAGSCVQGYSCGLVYSNKDDSGNVISAVCNCIPPVTTSCTYDKDKNACTGTCQSGGQCIQVGLSQTNVAAPVPMCGCEAAKCYFDYTKDSCVGSCSETTTICQLNTMYRDATTGKTTYGECHCKAKGEIPPLTGVTPFGITPTTATGQPCGCSAAANACTGDCAAGQTCFMTGTTTDAAGKNICSTCECKAVCQLDATGSQCTGYCPQNGACQMFTDKDPTTGAIKASCGCGGTGAAPAPVAKAPDVIASIGNFFKSLFGMK